MEHRDLIHLHLSDRPSGAALGGSQREGKQYGSQKNQDAHVQMIRQRRGGSTGSTGQKQSWSGKLCSGSLQGYSPVFSSEDWTPPLTQLVWTASTETAGPCRSSISMVPSIATFMDFTTNDTSHRPTCISIMGCPRVARPPAPNDRKPWVGLGSPGFVHGPETDAWTFAAIRNLTCRFFVMFLGGAPLRTGQRRRAPGPRVGRRTTRSPHCTRPHQNRHMADAGFHGGGSKRQAGA